MVIKYLIHRKPLNTLSLVITYFSFFNIIQDGFNADIYPNPNKGIFNIKTGEAISPPACDDLKTYPVKVENDLVYINIP